jgi:hypothetical protein
VHIHATCRDGLAGARFGQVIRRDERHASLPLAGS